MPLPVQLVARAFQQYWRATRGLRLFVEACVFDQAGRVLMVCAENGGRWELPGGPVRKGETLEAALHRILCELLKIEVNGRPELSFLYAPAADGHAGVFAVRNWQRLSLAASPETNFFPPEALPLGVAAETGERIRRSLGQPTRSEV
ncbi:MAG: NUDIX domain-containing protein [Hyphomicrobium sp.]